MDFEWIYWWFISIRMGSRAEQQCSHQWKGSSIVIYARSKLHFTLSKMMELGEGFISIRYNIFSKCFSVRKKNNETAAFVWLFNFIISKLLSVLKTFVSSWNRISVWMMPAPSGIYSIALVLCSMIFFVIQLRRIWFGLQRTRTSRDPTTNFLDTLWEWLRPRCRYSTLCSQSHVEGTFVRFLGILRI